MVHHVRKKTYTKTARWYNLTFLSLITLGSTIFVISVLIGPYRTGASAIEAFRSVTIAVTGTLGILGIVQEKSWEKWLVIVSYGLCIFAIAEGIINSFSAENIFQLINQNVSIALRIVRFIVIVVLLLGVIFMFRKSDRGHEVSK